MGIEAEIARIGTSMVYDIFPGADTNYSAVQGIAVQGNSGNITVTRIDGTNKTIPVLSGQVLPIGFKAIIAATTTATNILVMRSR